MSNCNPTSRVCIQTKKVFDACLRQTSLENFTIVLTNFEPPNPALPLTFVAGRSITALATVENLNVTRIPDRPRFGRVEADLVIPVRINYVDAMGREGVGTGTVTLHEDVIMLLPEPSIMPFQVEAAVSVIIPEGRFFPTEQGLTFVCTVCISVILKIVISVELIIPTFGYAVIPPCQDFTQDLCSGFFELPLFPGVNI